MIRIICFCVVMAALAAAQNATPNAAALSVLEQTARQKTAEWDALARKLDSSIIQLLPCDPKAAAAITAVSKASDARVAALAAYLEEAGRQTSLQAAAARGVLASVAPLGVDLALEKSDLAQEQLGVNGQIGSLTESALRRPSFNGPQDALRQIAALEQQRSDTVDSEISHSNAVLEPMRDLVAQLEAREQDLKVAQAAFTTEGVRWSAYYAARLARAQTECTVTKGVAATPARPQGKQK